ncbi:hypothetical protein HK101_000846 [Irineochytrium annulatum]|nr:hypothetical protein HK101_000846 [Irineochytrium annulatum]
MPNVDVAYLNSLTVRFNLAADVLSSVTCLAVLVFMFVNPARGPTVTARSRLLIMLFFADSLITGSTFCNFGGWIGQWSAQASDLATLALAITTYAVSKSATSLTSLSHRLHQVDSASPFLLAAIVLIPVVTATIGYEVVGMSAGASWCWYASKPKPLANYIRYGLAHGPRVAIILSIVVMYLDVFVAFSRKIKSNESQLPPQTVTSGSGRVFSNNSNSSASDLTAVDPNGWSATGKSMSGDGGGTEMGMRSGSGFGEEHHQRRLQRRKVEAQKAAIMKLLVYPTIYALLWIPGIANRLAEASQQSPQTIAITTFCQFTTQLVGFANAVVYGFSTLCITSNV